MDLPLGKSAYLICGDDEFRVSLATKELLDRLVPEGVHEAYLCGSPGMLEACVAVLAPHGIPADRVYVKYTEYDKWGWNGSNF